MTTQRNALRLRRVCNRISQQLPEFKDHPLEFITMIGDPDRTVCFFYLGSGAYVEHVDIKKCSTQAALTDFVKIQLKDALQEIRRYAAKQIKALEDVK